MKQPLDHLRSRKKPVSKPFWMALDSEIADEHTAANLRVQSLQSQVNARPNDRDLADKLDSAEEELDRATETMKANSAKFVARSIGHKGWDKLISDHVPTDAQRRDARKEGVGELSFNPDTFPPAAILACVSYVTGEEEGEDGRIHDILEPLDEEFVTDLFDDERWNQAEVTGLFQVAYECNTVRRVVDMGKGSGRVGRS